MQHFNELFLAPTEIDHVDSLDSLGGRASTEMNQDLTREFTQKEIYDALHQMHPSKAPSPDGMPPIFFQKYWLVLGNSLFVSLLTALSTRIFPYTLNHTHIVLFQRKKHERKLVTFVP